MKRDERDIRDKEQIEEKKEALDVKLKRKKLKHAYNKI